MTNIKQFPRKQAALPEDCKNTEAYVMNEVLYSDEKTKTVTDFTTGEQRNRRWGMVLSFAVIPQFDQVPPNQGPTLLPKTVSRFITSDTLEELKARVCYEIDKALGMAKLAVDNPEEFVRKHTEAINNDQDDMN